MVEGRLSPIESKQFAEFQKFDSMTRSRISKLVTMINRIPIGSYKKGRSKGRQNLGDKVFVTIEALFYHNKKVDYTDLFNTLAFHNKEAQLNWHVDGQGKIAYFTIPQRIVEQAQAYNKFYSKEER